MAVQKQPTGVFHRPVVLGLTFLAVVAGLWFGSLAWYGLNIGEEGATVHLFARTARGEIPYVDFISGYTPGYFYYHAALLRSFGESLLSVRLPLAVVHVANVLLLYRWACAVMPPVWALVPALAYMASLPVVEWSECSFNVPYPAWYTLLFFSLGWFAARAAVRSGGCRWALLAGVLAGLAFSFKPNSGLFQLAFTVLLVAALPARGVFGQGLRSLAVAAVVAGIAAVLRHHWQAEELFVFFAPLVASAAFLLVVPVAREDPQRGSGRVPAALLASVAAGFAACVLPWLFWWWRQLGTERFLHDVLFVGTGYERFFYEPYRASLPMLVAAALAALTLWWLIGRAGSQTLASPGQRRLLASGLGVIAAAALVRVWVRASMPEGFLAASISAFQAGAFLVVPATHWLGVACLSPAARHRHGADSLALVALVLAAPCYWLNAYPRSDYFHVAYAAPPSVVLVVFCVRVFAAGLARLLGLQTPRPLAAAAWIALMLLLAVVSHPQQRLVAQVWTHALGKQAGLEWLDTRRALVLIQAGSGGQRQRDLAALVAELGTRAKEGEWLFTFPDLELVTFLSGLRSPARIGYFKAGWPAHAVEAEVVDSLRERRPRWVISEAPASLFFADSPAYFFLLRDFVARYYRLHARFGSFLLFGQDGGALPEPDLISASIEPPPSVPATCDRAALQELRHSTDPAAARVWAVGWQRFASQWPERCARFALRVLGERGDAEVARRLFSAGPAHAHLQGEWEGALWNLALRALLERFAWHDGEQAQRGERQAWRELSEEESARLRGFLRREASPLRVFAAWALAANGAASSEPLPAGDATVDVLARAIVLTGREASPEQWAEVLIHEPQLPNLLPALFLAAVEKAPQHGLAAVLATWPRASEETRETLAYLLSVTADPGACAALGEFALSETSRAVRRALQWTARDLAARGICTHDSFSR